VPKTSIDLNRANEELEGKSPADILRWAVATFGDRFALQSSMQKSAGVLMHMLSEIAPTTEIIFVDTGVHFRETLDVRDAFIRRFGLNIRTYHPHESLPDQNLRHGRDLHLHDDAIDPPGYRECCRLRKEEPYLQAVRGRFDAVAGGLTREEGGARSDIRIVSDDPRVDGYKIYPLAAWTEAMIDDYTRTHSLPLHRLYSFGYPSIGCFTCTTPVRPGEPRRAGRWRHIREANPKLAGSQLYCGINLADKRKDVGQDI
jgi:phosphoadenosine phosphosulfate reductase